MIKTCSRCGKTKDQKDWHGRQCWECLLKYRKTWELRSVDWIRENRKKHAARNIERAAQWNKENADKHRKHCLAYYYRLQDEAIQAYGGYKCACCGETEPLFMTLDHIANDGNEHRKKLGFLGGHLLYKWLKGHNYPSGFQVLCTNCNHGKHRNHGVCPHQRT